MTTRLPDAPWQHRAGLAALMSALDGANGAIRYVGGAVRDTLIGLDVSDIDCATILPPETVAGRIRDAGFKAVPTGIAHGTVTAVLPGATVEVTTLRRDVSTDGRRATVAFTDDWREDAARRDFTINALFADPLNREVIDYFGGLDDLAAGRIRFIGDPLTRIAEDHLRILRFFRFHARFGRGKPDAAGLAACAARANDLMGLSRERIADELLKLLALPDPRETVALMHAQGIFAPVLPEIETTGIARLARLIGREAIAGIAPDAARRLAALLPRDPVTVVQVAARLRLSNAIRGRLELLASPPAADAPPVPIAYRHPDAAIDLILLSDSDDAALAAAIAMLDGWQRPVFPLKGGDLVKRGLRPGPRVAAALQSIERNWIAAGFPSDDWVERAAAAAVDQALRDRQ
ncbi:CCA tRNA nucleotidyltransferase [Sphingomonas sp. KC8]|uniref:CCA tRNA nucleotidyltransferase n=1 Tax=Sphingomonas sp. KC8 TaxID=1030157 RepID=UPI0004956BCF|nr:CCA tRNA nucleotidyltransferase [Sphingomonas sp. KC8]ARS29552.1 polynucleotide adenylyltransferase [Sphingomonas sp. KC8]